MSVEGNTSMNALTLRMQDEMFAIEAGSVREILDLVPITEVPNAPPFAAGLINVRGRVVPLADLRVVCQRVPPAGYRRFQFNPLLDLVFHLPPPGCILVRVRWICNQ